MRTVRVLLQGFGVFVVFVGTARTLEAMGMENAVWSCVLAAMVATFLMAALL